jgi:hypothetical protein
MSALSPLAFIEAFVLEIVHAVDDADEAVFLPRGCFMTLWAQTMGDWPIEPGDILKQPMFLKDNEGMGVSAGCCPHPV